jgi:hypothetical protein
MSKKSKKAKPEKKNKKLTVKDLKSIKGGLKVSGTKSVSEGGSGTAQEYRYTFESAS